MQNEIKRPYQYVIAFRIVLMSFISDIVEVGKLLRKIAFILTLLEYVLLLVPVPGSVDFSEVLNNEVAGLYPILPLTEDANPFGVDSEVSINVVADHINA